MFATTSLQIPAATLFQFLSFMQLHCHGIEPALAAGEALHQWMDRRRRGETGDTEPALGGFRWKNLYLPDGTRLHASGNGNSGIAYVAGDRLLYQGKSTTPNKFARLVLGYPCNAWKHIAITMPWDTRPVLAAAIRRDPNSPAFVPTPQQVPGVAGRSASGSFLPRRRLRLLDYPKLWPDFERREPRSERRLGRERRLVDALWEE